MMHFLLGEQQHFFFLKIYTCIMGIHYLNRDNAQMSLPNVVMQCFKVLGAITGFWVATSHSPLCALIVYCPFPSTVLAQLTWDCAPNQMGK